MKIIEKEIQRELEREKTRNVAKLSLANKFEKEMNH